MSNATLSQTNEVETDITKEYSSGSEVLVSDFLLPTLSLQKAMGHVRSVVGFPQCCISVSD